MQSPEKPSRLGILSFISAILIFVIWCIYFIVFAATIEGGLNFGLNDETAGYMVVFGGGVLMAVLTILLTVAGIILGVLALRKGDPRRGLALAGLILNLLCLLPYCALFAFTALSGMSSPFGS